MSVPPPAPFAAFKAPAGPAPFTPKGLPAAPTLGAPAAPFAPKTFSPSPAGVAASAPFKSFAPPPFVAGGVKAAVAPPPGVGAPPPAAPQGPAAAAPAPAVAAPPPAAAKAPAPAPQLQPQPGVAPPAPGFAGAKSVVPCGGGVVPLAAAPVKTVAAAPPQAVAGGLQPRPVATTPTPAFAKQPFPQPAPQQQQQYGGGAVASSAAPSPSPAPSRPPLGLPTPAGGPASPFAFKAAPSLPMPNKALPFAQAGAASPLSVTSPVVTGTPGATAAPLRFAAAPFAGVVPGTAATTNAPPPFAGFQGVAGPGLPRGPSTAAPNFPFAGGPATAGVAPPPSAGAFGPPPAKSAPAPPPAADQGVAPGPAQQQLPQQRPPGPSYTPPQQQMPQTPPMFAQQQHQQQQPQQQPLTSQNLQQYQQQQAQLQQQQQQQQQTPQTPQTPVQSASSQPTGPGKARIRNKPQGQNRIDSAQMPSPCRDLLVDGHPSYKWPPVPHSSDKSLVPPTTASGTPFLDEGNAVAKFLRPTMHLLPWEDSALSKASMPWGAVLSPLCSHSVANNNTTLGGNPMPAAERWQIPVVTREHINTPGHEPVRCARCRAFMNSWNPFGGTGHSWVCAFCGMSNDTAESYYSPVAAGGKRRDHLDRPELCRGSYEVDVTELEKYWAENADTKKPIKPRPMNHLFVIDVSRQAAPALKAIATAIRDAVDAMPASGFGMCNVSFVTYASTLHFYDFSDPQMRMPQMIVPDTANPFVPLPFNMLCWLNVEEQREQINAFLARLESEELVNTVDETGCAIGAAAKVAQLILSDIGGKVILTGTSAPTVGVGMFPERDIGRMYGNPSLEPQLFKPHDGFWPQLGLECSKRHVSFDLFLFPSVNVDLITLGQLCHLTNGKQWLFFNFREESDGLRLRRRMAHALNDEAGYAAILRTRCSNGVRVRAYHGHFVQPDVLVQDMDLANVDASSTFFVELQLDGKLEKKGAAVVQVALLYTTRSGHRRVRVHTLRLNVAENIANLFRYTDLEATLQAFICLSIHEAFNKGIKAAREFIISRTVDLLVGYRLHSQTGSHSGQLLLPENLKLLPVYNLCLMKSDALASGTVVRFDDRIQNMFELLSYPQERLLYYLYPRLFALHHLQDRAGEYKTTEGGVEEEEETEVGMRPKVFLPAMLQLTADNIYQGGVYVLQDLQARIVFLLIGSQVAPSLMTSIFGVAEGDPTAVVAQATMDEWNPRVRRIVQQLMDETGRLVILREKQDPALEDAFFRNLLEDEGPNKETCYSEFLCLLHKQIGQRTK